MGFKVFRRKKLKLKETYRHEMLISYTLKLCKNILDWTIEATKKNRFFEADWWGDPLKEFEIFLWKKRRIQLCQDSSPGLLIAGRLLKPTELHRHLTSPSPQEDFFISPNGTALRL